MLKVLIVDDEPLARENLRILLETQPDIEIVGECGNAVEAIGAVHKLRPDVLCYTTPPLAADAVITGDCSVELFISSDAEDTDFIVRVTEATPDGKSIKLADGVLCEFSLFDTLEQSLAYAAQRRIGRVVSVGKNGDRQEYEL